MGLSDLVFAGMSQAASVHCCNVLSGAGSRSGPSDTGQWPRGLVLSGPHVVGVQWTPVEGMEGLQLGCEGGRRRDFSCCYGCEIVLLKFVEQLLCATHFANPLRSINLFYLPNNPILLSPFYRWGN